MSNELSPLEHTTLAAHGSNLSELFELRAVDNHVATAAYVPTGDALVANCVVADVAHVGRAAVVDCTKDVAAVSAFASWWWVKYRLCKCHTLPARRLHKRSSSHVL